MGHATRVTMAGLVIVLVHGMLNRAEALQVLLNDSTTTTHLSNTQSFAFGAATIQAAGFTNGTDTNLVLKGNASVWERGLGIDADSQDEINTNQFIRLDVTDVIQKGIPDLFLTIGSIQKGEGYTIYGSTDAGAFSGGSLLESYVEANNVSGLSQLRLTGNLLPTSLVSPLGNDHYYLFVTGGGDGGSHNVLITGFSAAPEPSTFVLGEMAAAAGLGVAWRRRRAARADIA